MPTAHHHLWPIQQGDVLELRDEDYLFGQGDLLLRVAAVHDIRQIWGEAWIFLGGNELRADGHGRQWRDVVVRREAVRTRRRRPM
jgi:hypothetical protein